MAWLIKMVHRDLKIGLVLGLILVIGIVIKLATDPHLSPQARMTELNSSLDTKNKTDTNDVTQTYVVSNISLDSEQTELPPTGRSDSTLIMQNNQLHNLFPTKQSAQAGIESQKDNINQKESAGNPTVVNEQSAQPEYIDYDNAEVIRTERFYIVGKNQTLSEISRLYYHSANQWQRIVDANPKIKNPNKIKPGMKLIIPWDDE
jgi:nucleoid-associated protein YgaU